MLDIQMKELAKARRILDVLGCKYAIVLPDGVMFGELQIVKQTKNKQQKARRDFSSLAIQERIRVMNVGDVIELQGTPDFNLEDIQGNASSCGISAFGNGNFVTSHNKQNNTVECMRTG